MTSRRVRCSRRFILLRATFPLEFLSSSPCFEFQLRQGSLLQGKIQRHRSNPTHCTPSPRRHLDEESVPGAGGWRAGQEIDLHEGPGDSWMKLVYFACIS